MRLLPRFRQKAATGVIPWQPGLGVTIEPELETAARAAYLWGLRQTPEDLWDNQPYVRTVVTFLASNIAHLGLHVYRRDSDTERIRLKPQDSRFAAALATPSDTATTYELVYGLVADQALYERAYWLVESNGLRRLPPSWVLDHLAPRNDPFRIEGLVIAPPNGTRTVIPRGRFLAFVGWAPLDPTGIPQPALTSLRHVLAEQAAAYEFRARTWDNGLNVNRWIKRPADAPEWSDKAKTRFLEDLRATFAKRGNRAGGTPVLEEGMELHAERFQAREAEWSDGVKLSLQLVAMAYLINPVMIGLTENSNYSNAVEFRRSLYVDTLGSRIAAIEARINQFLRPLFTDDDREYAEFNVEEKLEGSFEEQAKALQTSVGGPWMTRAEARAIKNLAPIEADGTDDPNKLIVPLNVAVGGLAAPNDTAPPAGLASGGWRVRVKARPSEPLIARTKRLLSEVFGQQEQVIRSRVGAKAAIDEAYDEQRWHGELATVLQATGLTGSVLAGQATMERLGQPADGYDQDRTLVYWATKATALASGVSAVAKDRWAKAAEGEEAFDHVAEVLGGWYAGELAQSHITDAAGFGTAEAPRQLGVTAVKTWHTTSANPRSSHALVNGETVDLDGTFSNGARWPGDSTLPDAERANCHCVMTISVR